MWIGLIAVVVAIGLGLGVAACLVRRRVRDCHGRGIDRGIVLSGLPPDIDDDLCARTIASHRDGGDRSSRLASGAGPGRRNTSTPCSWAKLTGRKPARRETDRHAAGSPRRELSLQHMDTESFEHSQGAAHHRLPLQPAGLVRRSSADAAPARQPRPSPDSNQPELLAAGVAALASRRVRQFGRHRVVRRAGDRAADRKQPRARDIRGERTGVSDLSGGDELPVHLFRGRSDRPRRMLERHHRDPGDRLGTWTRGFVRTREDTGKIFKRRLQEEYSALRQTSA